MVQGSTVTATTPKDGLSVRNTIDNGCLGLGFVDHDSLVFRLINHGCHYITGHEPRVREPFRDRPASGENRSHT